MKKLADLLKVIEGATNAADLDAAKATLATLANDIKEFDAGYLDELKTKNTEIRGLNDKVKGFDTSKGQFDVIKGNYTKVLKALDLDEDLEDIDTELASLSEKLQAGELASKSKGELENQIATLTKSHTSTVKELTKLANEKTLLESTVATERTKRQTAIKDRTIMSALADNKVIKPKEIAKILAHSVKVNDDDTLTYINAKGEEVEFEEGIKSWVTENPEFISNEQNPGSGSGGGAAGGGVGRVAVTAAQFKDPAWYEKNRDAVMDDRVDIVG